MRTAEERDQEIVACAARLRGRVVIACTNLSNFKCMNLVLGHEECDRVLQRVEKYLANISVGCWRTAGDEFVAVFDQAEDPCVELLRDFARMFQSRTGAAEAWTFDDDPRVYPYRTMDVIMTPRWGWAEVSGSQALALESARAQCEKHLEAAFAAEWRELDAPWAGFPALARHWSNEKRFLDRACPKCESSEVRALDGGLGWDRESCQACGHEFERHNKLVVHGEIFGGGYA